MQYLYDRIYFPGEPERLLKADLDALNKEATKLSLTPPPFSPFLLWQRSHVLDSLVGLSLSRGKSEWFLVLKFIDPVKNKDIG